MLESDFYCRDTNSHTKEINNRKKLLHILYHRNKKQIQEYKIHIYILTIELYHLEIIESDNEI